MITKRLKKDDIIKLDCGCLVKMTTQTEGFFIKYVCSEAKRENSLTRNVFPICLNDADRTLSKEEATMILL